MGSATATRQNNSSHHNGGFPKKDGSPARQMSPGNRTPPRNGHNRYNQKRYHKHSKQEDRTIIITTAYGEPRQVTSRPTYPTRTLVCCRGSHFNNKLTVYNRNNVTTGTPLMDKKLRMTDDKKRKKNLGETNKNGREPK